MLTKELIENIETNFNRYITLFPTKSNEILNICKSLSNELRVYFMKAITQMPATDVISVDISDILQHVIHVYKIVTNINYCKEIPIDIIFDYILPYRVNDEDFSLYNIQFYRELSTLINTENISESALAANYWCYSKATYAQADDRTQNAIATIKSGRGRCGEESVLLVSALRSIGIPSRQCYSPYWSHCDDNHAWVEVYTGLGWEFLGACEPEERLNLGWFNNAASRALITRHRVFGLGDRQINNDQNNIFTTVTSTNIYVKTRIVTVNVYNNGKKIPYANVGLYAINYCMPKLIFEKTSDCNGTVQFEVGMGNSLFFTYYNGKYDMVVCSEKTNQVNLDISRCIKSVDFNLIPYEGDIQSDDIIPSKIHMDKLALLQNIREESHIQARSTNNKYTELAKLNSDVIEMFINNTSILDEHKVEILESLTKKDFCDIKYEALCDMVLAYEYKDKFSTEVFNKYLLPLRVENEPLYPYKKYIKEYFKNKTTIEDILELINNEMTIVDKYTYNGLVPDIKGVIKNKLITTFSLPIHLVQISRAIGIPARLNPTTRQPEYFNGEKFMYFYENNVNNSIDIDNAIISTVKETIMSIDKNTKLNLSYGSDFTICHIKDGYFNYLNFEKGITLPIQISVEEGLYATTQATRQIDGSLIGTIYFNNNVTLQDPIIFTKDKLKKIDVPDEIIHTTNGKKVLAYIQNNSEPTEHFLNEILENEEKILISNIEVILYGSTNEKNDTLSLILNKNLAKYNISEFNNSWKQFRKDMHIGDLRLPFITATMDKKGLYSFANYNVGTVDMLLKIYDNV